MTSHLPHPPMRLATQVMRWCEFYTRQLPPDVAADRRQELASDLHEHTAWAQEAGIKPPALKRSILARAVRGAPADLSWRHAQQRNLALTSGLRPGVRRANLSVTAATAAAAAMLVVWGLFVIARIVLNAVRYSVPLWSDTAIVVVVAWILAALGLALVVRSKTRALGALWLIAPSLVLIPTGAGALFSISASVETLTLVVPYWVFSTHLLTIGLALFFLAASVWAWPSTLSARTDPISKELL